MEKKKEPVSLSIASLASSEEIQALKWVNLPPATQSIIWMGLLSHEALIQIKIAF